MTRLQARVIDKESTAKIVNAKHFNASLIYIEETAMLVFENPTATLISTPLIAPSNDGLATIFNFTVNDLIDGKITRSHNLNTDVVDVTLRDPSGRIINCQTSITRNTVTLDLKRIQVVGTWQFLVERL